MLGALARRAGRMRARRSDLAGLRRGARDARLRGAQSGGPHRRDGVTAHGGPPAPRGPLSVRAAPCVARRLLAYYDYDAPWQLTSAFGLSSRVLLLLVTHCSLARSLTPRSLLLYLSPLSASTCCQGARVPRAPGGGSGAAEAGPVHLRALQAPGVDHSRGACLLARSLACD